MLNVLRISLVEIVEYTRDLRSYEENFLVGEAIGVLMVNDLTNGGLEYHDEYERIVARVPSRLATAVENVTQCLLEFEEGATRRDMFGISMRIIAEGLREPLV